MRYASSRRKPLHQFVVLLRGEVDTTVRDHTDRTAPRSASGSVTNPLPTGQSVLPSVECAETLHHDDVERVLHRPRRPTLRGIGSDSESPPSVSPKSSRSGGGRRDIV